MTTYIKSDKAKRVYDINEMGMASEWPGVNQGVFFIGDSDTQLPLTPGLARMLLEQGEIFAESSDADVLRWIARWALQHGTGAMLDDMPSGISHYWLDVIAREEMLMLPEVVSDPELVESEVVVDPEEVVG